MNADIQYNITIVTKYAKLMKKLRNWKHDKQEYRQITRICGRVNALFPKEVKQGLNSLITLGAWMLWKHRNDCVFNGANPNLQLVIRSLEPYLRRLISGPLLALRGYRN